MRAKDFFLGKRVAVLGLGAHGEMISDVKFLVKANALVSVYDLRNEARMGSAASALRGIGLANSVPGMIPEDDLLDMDLIILSHEYPKNSSFLATARKNGIQIEYPETLFLKLVPPVTVVGVMGACGKSTVISMLAPMLASLPSPAEEEGRFILDPDSGEGILAPIKSMKSGDLVIMRISDEMLPEIHALRWSPHVAVFTSVPSPGSYKDSPYEILAYQTYNNYVIGRDHVIDAVRTSGLASKARMLRTRSSSVPDEWLPEGRAIHDRENAALALEAARIFKVSDESAQIALSNWKPLRGRLELVKKVRGVEFWNDTASVSPHATIAGMAALSGEKNLVVIIGGAHSGADYRELYVAIPKYAHTAIVLPGSGTMLERKAFSALDDVTVVSVPSIEGAVRQSLDHAQKGDRVLFSPGFAAGGMDSSRRERGERFVRAVRAL